MAQFNPKPAIQQEIEFTKSVKVAYSNIRGQAQINPGDTAIVLHVDKNAGDSLYTLALRDGNTVVMPLIKLMKVVRAVQDTHIAPPMLVVESNPTFNEGDHVLFARACVGLHVPINTRGQVTKVRPDEYVVKLANGRSVRLPLTLIRSITNPLALISRGDERVKPGYYVSTPDGKKGIVRSANNHPEGESEIALDPEYGIDNLAVYSTRALTVELAAPPEKAPSRTLATVGKGKKRASRETVSRGDKFTIAPDSLGIFQAIEPELQEGATLTIRDIFYEDAEVYMTNPGSGDTVEITINSPELKGVTIDLWMDDLLDYINNGDLVSVIAPARSVKKPPAKRAVPWSDTPTLFNSNDEPVLAQEGDTVKVIAPTNSIFIGDERYEINVGEIGTITEVRHDGLYIRFPALVDVVSEIFFDRHEAIKVLNVETVMERSKANRSAKTASRRQSYKRNDFTSNTFRIQFDCQAQTQDGGMIDCYEGDYITLGEEMVYPPDAQAAVLETETDNGLTVYNIIVDATWMTNNATPVIRNKRSRQVRAVVTPTTIALDRVVSDIVEFKGITTVGDAMNTNIHDPFAGRLEEFNPNLSFDEAVAEAVEYDYVSVVENGVYDYIYFNASYFDGSTTSPYVEDKQGNLVPKHTKEIGFPIDDWEPPDHGYQDDGSNYDPVLMGRMARRHQSPVFIKAALRPKMRRQAFPKRLRPVRSKPKQWVAKRPLVLVNFRTGQPEPVAAGSTVVEHSNFVTRDKQVGVVLGRQGGRYHYQITRAQLRKFFALPQTKPSRSVRSPLQGRRLKRIAPDFALNQVSGLALDLLDELGRWMASNGVGLGEYKIEFSEWESWSDEVYGLFVELEQAGYLESAAGSWAVTNAGLGAMSQGWSVDEENNTLYSQKRNRRAAPKRLGGVPNYDSYLEPSDNEPLTDDEQNAAWMEQGFNLKVGDTIFYDEITEEIDNALYSAAAEQGQDQPDDSDYHFVVSDIDWDDESVFITNVLTGLSMTIPFKKLLNVQPVAMRSKATRASLPGIGEEVTFNQDYFNPTDSNSTEVVASKGETGVVVDYGSMPEGGVLVNMGTKREVHVYEEDVDAILWWASETAPLLPSAYIGGVPEMHRRHKTALTGPTIRAIQDGMYITAERDARLTDVDGKSYTVYEGYSYKLTSINESAQTARITSEFAEEVPSDIADELSEWTPDFEGEEYDPSESFSKPYYPSTIVSFDELTAPGLFTDTNMQPITTTLAARAVRSATYITAQKDAVLTTLYDTPFYVYEGEKYVISSVMQDGGYSTLHITSAVSDALTALLDFDEILGSNAFVDDNGQPVTEELLANSNDTSWLSEED